MNNESQFSINSHTTYLQKLLQHKLIDPRQSYGRASPTNRDEIRIETNGMKQQTSRLFLGAAARIQSTAQILPRILTDGVPEFLPNARQRSARAEVLVQIPSLLRQVALSSHHATLR